MTIVHPTDFSEEADLAEQQAARLARSLGGEYQPYVALIDEAGRLVATFDGGGTHEDWEALLAKL